MKMPHSNHILNAFLNNPDDVVAQTKKVSEALYSGDNLDHATQLCRFIIKNQSLDLFKIVKNYIPLDARAHKDVQNTLKSREVPVQLKMFFTEPVVTERINTIDRTENLAAHMRVKGLPNLVKELPHVDIQYKDGLLLRNCIDMGWFKGLEYIFNERNITSDPHQRMTIFATRCIINKLAKKGAPTLSFTQYWDDKRSVVRFVPDAQKNNENVNRWKILGLCESLERKPIILKKIDSPVAHVLNHWAATRQRMAIENALEGVSNAFVQRKM